MTTKPSGPGGGRRAIMGAPLLAEAKLAPPRPAAGIIERPRIMQALDSGEEAALTLVAAPVGYGKTTAVRAWAASRNAALAWVTLDAGDNDPVRMWTYVTAAVDRVRHDLAGRALRQLGLGGDVIESSIDELMNGIEAYGEALVVVFDDLQTVTDGDALASIAYALKRVPSNARVVALTRTDPALALPQLRARGALAELRASELAFTRAESDDFLLHRHRIELHADELELLHDRTEGWPAALLLAALWLRSVEDPRLAVERFGGDHRFLADYLSHEVIDSLPDAARSFLLRVAVLRRFTAELADHVLGRDDSSGLLAELERTNLLVVRLEQGGWYRVHALFAEFAGFQLACDDPAAVQEIHRRAARWLRVRGLAAEALEHGAAAGDHEFVADVLAEYHPLVSPSGGARTLRRWVRTLPDEYVVAHPALAVGAATAATMIGRALERRRLLHLVDRAKTEHPERFTAYVLAVEGTVRATAVDRSVADAVAAGRRAVEIAQESADEVLVAALAGYARALYLAGDPDEAWDVALRAVEHPDARRAPEQAFARSTLALVAAQRGRLESAWIHSETAKTLVGRAGSSRSWLGANAAAAMGCVLSADGHFAEAERELATVEPFFRDEVATVHHAWLLVLLARVRCRRGRLDAARTTLVSARATMAELVDCERVSSLADEVEQELESAFDRAGDGEMLDRPSAAELAVLRHLAGELSTRQIAEQLFLSPNTVRTHTRAIYRKLAVNSRVDAVARADALGLFGQTESPR